MNKETYKKFVVLFVMFFSLAITACDEGEDCQDGDCDYPVDTNNNPINTGGESDLDTDTDTDTDADADSDTDTDTNPPVPDDPTACDCLNGKSTAEGCADIQGDWYLTNRPRAEDTRLTISLTIEGKDCKVESSGEANFFYPLYGKELPLDTYNEADDQYVKISLVDSYLRRELMGYLVNNDILFSR